jgi:hypothetical protein
MDNFIHTHPMLYFFCGKTLTRTNNIFDFSDFFNRKNNVVVGESHTGVIMAFIVLRNPQNRYPPFFKKGSRNKLSLRVPEYERPTNIYKNIIAELINIS